MENGEGWRPVCRGRGDVTSLSSTRVGREVRVRKQEGWSRRESHEWLVAGDSVTVMTDGGVSGKAREVGLQISIS